MNVSIKFKMSGQPYLGLSCWSPKTSEHLKQGESTIVSCSNKFKIHSCDEVFSLCGRYLWLSYTWRHQVKWCATAMPAPKRNIAWHLLLHWEHLLPGVSTSIERPVCLTASFSQSVSPRQWLSWISPYIPPYRLLNWARRLWGL